MDQPQFLRHRYEPGSKATDVTNYTRSRYEAERTARSGETDESVPESGCHSPLGQAG